MALATEQGRYRGQGDLSLEPIPFELLDDPLEYLFVDHLRKRSLCTAFRRYANDGETARAEAETVIAFMRGDLRLHHEDEDEDLFSLLRKRAVPEDDLGVVLARLRYDHRKSEALGSSIAAALSRGRGETTFRLDERTRDLMRAFAMSGNRHLALENGVVLAIAHVRLTRSDIANMSCNMKTRRGV